MFVNTSLLLVQWQQIQFVSLTLYLELVSKCSAIWEQVPEAISYLSEEVATSFESH